MVEKKKNESSIDNWLYYIDVKNKKSKKKMVRQ
jgi:hypothetical protein